MKIRKANAADAAKIAPILLLAMEDIIYKFIGHSSKENALTFLRDMIALPRNQYSYDCCWILEEKGEIIGAANVYEGAKLHELRRPVAVYIKENYTKDFQPEDETEAGEYYIDCVGVHPDHQGKGIGTQIFLFLIEEYVNRQNQVLALLVDDENPHAERLYLRLGFKTVGKKQLVGKTLKHMQMSPG